MRRLSFLSLFVMPVAIWSADGAKPLDAFSDDPWVLISIDDLSETVDALDGHPLREAVWNDELRGLLDPNPKENSPDSRSIEEVLEQDFRLTVDQFFELFAGEVHLALYSLGDGSSGGTARPDLLLAADFNGDEERLSELMEVQFNRNAEAQRKVNPAMEHHMLEETFMGETLYFDEAFNGEQSYIEDGYALVDGVFILATPESRLRAAVEAVKEGVGAPIVRTPGFGQMTDTDGTSDGSVYVNFPAFVPKLNDALRESAKARWMVGFGITPDSLVDALSLDSIESFFLDFELREEGVLVRSGLTYGEKRGVLALLTYGSGELPNPTFVPEEPVSASISLFDTFAFYDAFRELLSSASPALGQIFDAQVQRLESNLDIPLRDSLLMNLGEEMVGFAVLDAPGLEGSSESEPRQLIAFSVRDPDSFTSALDGLLGQDSSLQSMLDRKEFEGHSIVTFPGQPDPYDPEKRLDDTSYAVTRSHVFLSIGREAVLMDSLSRLERVAGGFWQRDEVEDWFRPIALPRPVSRSYNDLERMSDSIVASLEQNLSGMPLALEQEMPDFEMVAEQIELPFILLAELNEEEGGLFGRVLLRTKPGEEDL